jgi:OCT family organic cation transporter-like MFS transporter 4/5
VGSLFGNVVFGWIADKWGRRTAFFAILFLEVIFSIATSFSPNYVIYTALRTVNGLFFPAIYQIPFILGTLNTLGTSSKSRTSSKFQGERGQKRILLK